MTTTKQAAPLDIYTDGGCLGNPGPGGYGVVLLYGEHRKELSAGYILTTNNRMELLACIVALESLKYPVKATIYSDSKYVVDSVEKGWARSWQKKNWRKSNKKPAENIDLWQRMLPLLDTHDITFHWVKGHAGNPENERCDELATMAAQGEAGLMKEDKGYKKQ